MMTLTIPLAPEAEAALRRRAAESGKDPVTVASELLTRVLTRTGGLTQNRLEEISGRTYEDFRDTGMTEEQLGEELENIKHADRSRKRGVPFND
jgi:hypothetical protein